MFHPPTSRAFSRILALVLLTPLGAHAQSATSPFDPATVSSRIEIGPVAGLTTTWHPAPTATGVPLGTVVPLRVRVPPGFDAIWTGAREVENRQGRSVAELRLDGPGSHTVEVQILGDESDPITETLRFEGVDLGTGLHFGRPRLEVEPIVIDEANPNASTLALYFQGSSIAALTELSAGAYRTSTNRWVTLAADLAPAALAPLVEWRLDGKVLADLGTPVRLQVFTTGPHTLRAGLESVSLETYRVRLTSPRRGDPIPIGSPVTFTAQTDPPGRESEISWLASTKYGHCQPAQGTGAEFTTTFSNTVGEAGTWLGVRADDAVLGLDGKGDECTAFQAAAQEAVTELPPVGSLPSEPAALHALLLHTREIAEDGAAGTICSEGRFGSVTGELSGLSRGLFTAFKLSGSPFFPDCTSQCVAVSLPQCVPTDPPEPLVPTIDLPDCNLAWMLCFENCSSAAAALPDLVVEPSPGVPFFCTGSTFVARIRNVGPGPAAATTTRFKFGEIGFVDYPTTEIPAGSYLDIGPVTPPTGCFSSDCFVEICADEGDSLDEVDETNNCAPGVCIG